MLMLLPFVSMDAFSIVKDIFSVLGVVLAAIGAAVGIIIALRKYTASKRQQERTNDIELSGKFARLETQVGHLQTAADSIERQYTEFRDRALRDQQELVKQIDELRTRCNFQQQNADLNALRQEVQRLKDRLERVDQEFRRHRDLVLDKYLTLASYQNDLIMMTRTFDDLRQSLRDVHLTLTKRSGK